MCISTGPGPWCHSKAVEAAAGCGLLNIEMCKEVDWLQ